MDGLLGGGMGPNSGSGMAGGGTKLGSEDYAAAFSGTPLPPEQPMQPSPPQSDPARELDKLMELTNIAEELDKEKLIEIGDQVFNGFKQDYDSKREWDKEVDQWTKLAAQIKEEKNYPWPKASNVKYPLLATAAMQFAARAYPSLVPADGKIVQFRVVGIDQDGQKMMLADKLAKHMNYQLLEDMEDWEEEMDRLLIMLPIVGCVFKKTYFDSIKKRNVSKVVGPKDLVVNYWATSLDAAYRKTEIILMNKNELVKHQNAGMYLKYEDEDDKLPDPTNSISMDLPIKVQPVTQPSELDKATPYVILEQHTFLDLDEDGYDEPYIVTIEQSSKKVLRVVARWDSDGVYSNPEGDVICIEPVEYYTKYGFIPNPDGGFYDIGFGHLLGPLNESANTLINVLVDSGHLSTLQAGFIGKGLRTKMGETKFTPGEWKSVNVTGDDIKKQIFPLPVAPPSDTLFKLLGMIIESGKELASVAEIFTGKMPGQNTPATTTQTAVEQGMKVFTAIYKRTYRSLAREFKKVFRLNSLHEENTQKAQIILDEPMTKYDYDLKSYDVCPTADPTAVSSTQKLLKAEALAQLLPLGTLNPMEVTKRLLEAQEQPNIQLLLQQPQPQKDPKVEAEQMKMKMEQEKHQLDMVQKQFELQMKQQELMMEQKFMEMEKKMEMQLKAMEFQQDTQMQNQQHTMDMTQMHQKAQMQAESNRIVAESPNPNKGKPGADGKQAGSGGMGKSSGNTSSSGSNSRKSK